MDDYTAEITEPIRQEVLVHGAAKVAERTGISEAAIREIAPEEAKRWDKAQANQ
jgi:hypothetical protein